MVEAAIFDILSEVNRDESLGVTDLGCSSGANSLTVISQIIHTVDAASRVIGLPVPELRVHLNDLPGSFYGRLFPSRSLHFVHSSSSLHWLSQVPLGLEPKVRTHMNKEKVYISKSSPVTVIEAYQRQFREDFSLFLRSRAKEMVIKGRMVLSFMGRRSLDPCADEACYQWELLARALVSLAQKVCILTYYTYNFLVFKCFRPHLVLQW